MNRVFFGVENAHGARADEHDRSDVTLLELVLPQGLQNRLRDRLPAVRDLEAPDEGRFEESVHVLL